MEIRFLGTHNVESASTRLTSMLVDGVLAVDAGAITSSLSLEEQAGVKQILLSHSHYDHVRDVAAITLNMSFFGKSIEVYGLADTLDALTDHILNGVIYPRFTEIRTPEQPPVKFLPMEPLKPRRIGDYTVLPIPVKHAVPAVAYQITSNTGISFFFSGDTAPGLSACWEYVSPQLLVIDVTMSNRVEEHATKSGHLAPHTLEHELVEFKRAKGYLPPVVIIHISPLFEEEIRREAVDVARSTGAEITISCEGMRLDI